MVDITILELNLSDSSFSAQAQWGEDEGEVDYEVNGEDDEDDGADGPSTAVAAVAVLVVLAVVAAVLKFLVGGDDPDVDIETPDEPVGVSIDDE